MRRGQSSRGFATSKEQLGSSHFVIAMPEEMPAYNADVAESLMREHPRSPHENSEGVKSNLKTLVEAKTNYCLGPDKNKLASIRP